MNQSQIIAPAVSSRAFVYRKETKCFIGELSEVKLGQVWNDSCDEGVAVVSAKTGKSEAFYVHAKEYNSEAELLSLILLPVNHALKAAGVTMCLFND